MCKKELYKQILVKLTNLQVYLIKLLKLGTTKTRNLIKTSLNVCGPFNYGLNTINKMNPNLPRYW